MSLRACRPQVNNDDEGNSKLKLLTVESLLFRHYKRQEGQTQHRCQANNRWHGVGVNFQRYVAGMRIGTQGRYLFLLAQGLLCVVVANSGIAQSTNTAGDPPEASAKVASDDTSPKGIRTAKDGWVPPDIDAVRPPVDNGAACSLNEVISKAGKRVEEFVDNLNRLTAKETVQHQTVSHSGTLHDPEIQKSEYVVSAKPTPDGNVYLEEYRGPSLNPSPEPSSDHVSVSGAFALVLIFHPYHAKDFRMTCEGLGAWHEQPAWQIRFEEQTNHMSGLVIEGKNYLLRLRGRAWILADSYQVGRLETDLVETIPKIHLRLQHQVIEYYPGSFPGTNVAMWLPSSAELYMDFRGHRFYRRHSYRDFQLFSVKVRQEFGEIR